ncbi:MAG TPA: hypothetical protein DIU18_05090 [Gemmatimonadetes bacterium]|nr:hypothetical protein [Gemmatimonadota bacterium]|tara:strand:+ start:86 stop:568 length:483 start_codon:yes stop_codon:yes gene_type:complete
MNPMTCPEIADRLPDWASDRLADTESALVAEHLDGCEDCSAQASVLGTLFVARPEAPAGMAENIARAGGVQAHSVTRERVRPSWRRPAWALPSAAVLVFAVGTTIIFRDSQTIEVASAIGEVPVEESQIWIANDGAVAGAPVLDDLSDEELRALVEELGA